MGRNPAPLVYVDTSEVRGGALERLKADFEELVDFVEEKVPDVLSYAVHLSDDGTRVTVVHVHLGSASLERHLRTGGPVFARFAEVLSLTAIRIYGDPSEEAVELAHGKARSLGCSDVAVHRAHAGFARFGSSRA